LQRLQPCNGLQRLQSAFDTLIPITVVGRALRRPSGHCLPYDQHGLLRNCCRGTLASIKPGKPVQQAIDIDVNVALVGCLTSRS